MSFPFFHLWYLPLGITHGNATLIAERLAIIQGRYIDVWLPSQWFTFFVAIAALVIFHFLTRKHHCKPIFTLAALTVAVQAIHALRELVKGSPIPAVNEFFYWTYPLPIGQSVCAFLYLWGTWVEAAEYALSAGILLLLARTAFSRKDQFSFTLNHSLFKKIIKFVVGYSLLYTFFIGIIVVFFSSFTTKTSSCGPLNPLPSVLGLIENIVWVAIDVLIFGSGIRHLYVMIKAAQTSSSGENRGWGVATKLFITLAVLQLSSRVGYNLWFLGIATAADPEDSIWWYSTLGLWLTYWASAIVLVLIGLVSKHHHFHTEEEADEESELLIL